MTDDLEERLKHGDQVAFGELFTLHRPRIWQIIHFRLSDKIRGRVDPDDVVQEVFLESEKRLRHFVDGSFPSLFLWLRLVTGQTLSKIHRTHLGTESRSTLRETGQLGNNVWGNTSLCLSQRFVAHMTSPSQAAVRGELIDEVRTALESMNDIDREVLALRHF
ncbi:MAG: RNA polymerase subunit sigma-24, partial [Planctomycetota bacterium]